MNAQQHEQNALEAGLRDKFKTREWLSFNNECNNINSNFYMKREFYDEHTANLKKLRYNKRNLTKDPHYYEQFPHYKDVNPDLDSTKSCDRIYQSSLPNTITYTHQGIGSRVYNCAFTNDGQNLVTTSQHGTAFFKFSDDNKVELSKVVACRNVNWAITDSDISSDNKFMIHSTLSPYIHMFDLENFKYKGVFTLKNAEQENQQNSDDFLWLFSLRVYSLKLSGDNTQVIAGCGRTVGGAPVQVFDLETSKVKNSVIAHSDDINSVSYVTKDNSSVFITGSDDGVCKLWDTRMLEGNKPQGIFYGHVSGLTYVSSKEDNKYFITNCKDQSIKLWDLRKSTTDRINYPFLKYDYRYEILGSDHIEQIKRSQQKVDKSVMTFWGHRVHLTLMRCHFSPMYGTAQRYIYTGSYDGRVYIYDTMSGQNVACLEPPNNDTTVVNAPIIRDCAWHPYSQTLVSTSFFGEIHKWEHMHVHSSERQPEIDSETKVMSQDDLKEEPMIEEPVKLERTMLRRNM